jgi:hypothetical protein
MKSPEVGVEGQAILPQNREFVQMRPETMKKREARLARQCLPSEAY